jgi:peptidoglycan-associated lipoprotein
VYFDIGTSKLDDKAMDTLKKNADWLKQNTPFMIEVDGYADTRGSTRKNHWVAERRAVSVRDYYASLGIPKNRILIKGMGEEQPTCAQMTEECLAQSRRGETLIENKAVASKP